MYISTLEKMTQNNRVYSKRVKFYKNQEAIIIYIIYQLSFYSRIFLSSYSNLALYKAGDVVTGVENRERPHDVLLQPIPVLNNLLFGDS